MQEMCVDKVQQNLSQWINSEACDLNVHWSLTRQWSDEETVTFLRWIHEIILNAFDWSSSASPCCSLFCSLMSPEWRISAELFIYTHLIFALRAVDWNVSQFTFSFAEFPEIPLHFSLNLDQNFTMWTDTDRLSVNLRSVRHHSFTLPCIIW